MNQTVQVRSHVAPGIDKRCRTAREGLLAVLAITVLTTPAAGQAIPREFVYLGGQLLAYQASFVDVLPNSPYYTYVNLIANLGITGGCGGTSYCPTAPVTRDSMAIFLLKAKEGPAYLPPACAPPNLFNDVPDTSPFCRWIEELANRGVTGGCGGGNYCPTSPVNREQMAVFLLVTKEGSGYLPPACSPPNMFNDVRRPARSAAGSRSLHAGG